MGKKKVETGKVRFNFKDGGHLLCPGISKYEVKGVWIFLYTPGNARRDCENGRVAVNEIKSFYWTPELTPEEQEEKERKERVETMKMDLKAKAEKEVSKKPWWKFRN